MNIEKVTRAAPLIGPRQPRCRREDETLPAKDIARPTEREGQLILLIAQGLPNKLIAHELGISPNTVRTHVSNIMRKYKLRNRTQIAMMLTPVLRTTPPVTAGCDR